MVRWSDPAAAGCTPVQVHFTYPFGLLIRVASRGAGNLDVSAKDVKLVNLAGAVASRGAGNLDVSGPDRGT